MKIITVATIVDAPIEAVGIGGSRKLMKAMLFAATLASLALYAPVSAQVADVAPIGPVEAIQRAAAAAPDGGAQGTFLLTVKASGEEKGPRTIFLNSELDYRDQRNLTVALEQPVLAELEAKYGKNLKTYFIGKQILVAGTARRVTIYFGRPQVSAVNGKPRNKYYFQTHVSVFRAEQIMVVPQTP